MATGSSAGIGLRTDFYSRNFTDVFKTPGKLRGKTPRTARKRDVEEHRVVGLRSISCSAINIKLTSFSQPLSEIFSSSHNGVGNKASTSPFIHRIVSRSTAATTTASSTFRPQNISENASQPQYPDLSENPNSFSKYNTDSGYHGLSVDEEAMLPETQPATQESSQPMDVDEPVHTNSQLDVSISQQTADESFHSAQENVRSRGETVEPGNRDLTAIQEQTTRSSETAFKESESEANSTPTDKTQHEPKAKLSPQTHEFESKAQLGFENPESESRDVVNRSPGGLLAPQSLEPVDLQDPDVEMKDLVKEDTVLDIGDIGSPSDGSTPERPMVRKSSLTFASLPAREPLTRSLGGSRISRTSHIDLPRLNNSGRVSYLGKQTGGSRMGQAPADDQDADLRTVDVNGEKEDNEQKDADHASKLHSTKSTQSLHERISMLGKVQPSRPKKSTPAVTSLSEGQIAYPDLPPPMPSARVESSSQKPHAFSAENGDEGDRIKPLDFPGSPNLIGNKTTDSEEKVPHLYEGQSVGENGNPTTQEQVSAGPERPKSSTSTFASPRAQPHQQSESRTYISVEVSTTPTGSPRRFDGPLSASKTRLQSIMKSAKGLFTSTGSTGKVENPSAEQPRLQPQLQGHVSTDLDMRKREFSEHPPHLPSSPSPLQYEGRRTRSSTEREEKRRQMEREEQQQEEERQRKFRQQEIQRTMQPKVLLDKSSVEPDDGIVSKPTQSLRHLSREGETADVGPKSIVQSKPSDRRPKPTREPVPMPKPQPVSIRVGSTLSRQIPMAPSASSTTQENLSVSAPAPSSKQTSLKKKGSNTSLHTASSTGNFKNSVSSQTQVQRKAQLASERKKEQDERELRRREEQKREQERKRAAQQQQEETRRQEMRSRAEAERERRERSAQEDPRKAAIEKRRLENARRHERQGSQQAPTDVRNSCFQKFQRSFTKCL